MVWLVLSWGFYWLIDWLIDSYLTVLFVIEFSARKGSCLPGICHEEGSCSEQQLCTSAPYVITRYCFSLKKLPESDITVHLSCQLLLLLTVLNYLFSLLSPLDIWEEKLQNKYQFFLLSEGAFQVSLSCLKISRTIILKT